MEKWKEIMSKCEKWSLNKSCTVEGELCDKFKGCVVRAELAEFQRTGKKELPPVTPKTTNTFCPLTLTAGKNNVLCQKDKCEWYIQLPAKYPNPLPEPCCVLVALVEVLVQLRLTQDEIKGIMEAKTT